MKNIYKTLSGIFLIAGLLFMYSCEEKVVLDYTEYSPEAPAKFSYAEKSFYPQKIVLASDTPVFSVEGVYSLKIDSVYAASENDYVKSDFNIDDATGVITYDNKGGSINPGEYSVDVSIHTVNSIVYMDKAYNFTVLDVPVSISADPAEVNAGALQQGVISTISYTDESPEQNLVVESYELNPFVQGYSINENGEVIKSTNAIPNSTDSLSILVNTNLGTKTFRNVVVVHVGPPPTILYPKASDGDTLRNVIMSPTSGYVTQPPVLTGMNYDGGWEVILADTVPQEVKDAISINSSGEITYKGSAAVPDGVYSISVKVTNSSGVSFTFNDLFTFTLKTKWEQITYVDKEFNPANGIISYAKDPASATMFSDGGGYAKGYHGANAIFNSWFIAKVDITSAWNGNKLLISFEERNGWGAKQDPVYAETARTLQYSYDQNTWTDIMSPNDAAWPMTGSGSFIAVNDKEVDGIDTDQTSIYFKWHYDNSASATLTKSVWMLDNLTFKYTIDYEIVEE